MTTYQTFNDLPVEIKTEIRRIQAIPAAQRSTAEAATLTAYDQQINNETPLKNADGEILIAVGSGVPTGLEGFVKGALFMDYDVATGLRGTYVNIGTSTAAVWELVGENTVEARTATETGATTGTISDYAKHVTVTSANADHIVILPAPRVGAQIVLNVGANGFELRSSAPATIAINGGAEADAESAIPANSTVFMTCVSATAWKGFYMDADGDLAKVPAAAAA